MEAMLDVLSGKRRSLAQVEELRLLIGGLDRLNALEAILSTESVSEDNYGGIWYDAYGFEAVEALRAEPLLLPYESYASGWSIDDVGPYLAVVLVHDDDATAKENVARLRARVRHGTSFHQGGIKWRQVLGPAKVSSDGRLVVAKIYTPAFLLWRNLVHQLDNLLAHE